MKFSILQDTPNAFINETSFLKRKARASTSANLFEYTHFPFVFFFNLISILINTKCKLSRWFAAVACQKSETIVTSNNKEVQLNEHDDIQNICSKNSNDGK